MATLDTQLSVTDERELQNRLSASSPVGSGGTGSIGESEAHVSINVFFTNPNVLWVTKLFGLVGVYYNYYSNNYNLYNN